MQSKLLILPLITILLGLNFSCSTTKSIETGADINVKQRSPLSDFFESYDYITLETNDSVIISNVDEFDVNDKTIAIQSGAKIFLFDPEGKSSGVISSKGNARNEYVEITDFILAGDSIYILSSPQKKILVFDDNTEYARTIDLDNLYFKLEAIDNGDIYLYSSNSNDTYYNFALLDAKSGKIKNRLDKFERHESMNFKNMNPYLGKTKDGNLYVSHPFDTSIYVLTPDSFEQISEYTFNTDDQLPGHYGDTPFIQLYDRTIVESVVKNLSNYYKKDNYELLVFPLFGEYGILYNIVKLENGKQTSFNPILEKVDKEFPYFSGPLKFLDDKVISVMTAGSILYIESHNGLSKFTDTGMDASNNPVVFFHKLK